MNTTSALDAIFGTLPAQKTTPEKSGDGSTFGFLAEFQQQTDGQDGPALATSPDVPEKPADPAANPNALAQIEPGANSDGKIAVVAEPGAKRNSAAKAMAPHAAAVLALVTPGVPTRSAPNWSGQGSVLPPGKQIAATPGPLVRPSEPAGSQIPATTDGANLPMPQSGNPNQTHQPAALPDEVNLAPGEAAEPVLSKPADKSGKTTPLVLPAPGHDQTPAAASQRPTTDSVPPVPPTSSGAVAGPVLPQSSPRSLTAPSQPATDSPEHITPPAAQAVAKARGPALWHPGADSARPTTPANDASASDTRALATSAEASTAHRPSAETATGPKPDTPKMGVAHQTGTITPGEPATQATPAPTQYRRDTDVIPTPKNPQGLPASADESAFVPPAAKSDTAPHAARLGHTPESLRTAAFPGTNPVRSAPEMTGAPASVDLQQTTAAAQRTLAPIAGSPPAPQALPAMMMIDGRPAPMLYPSMADAASGAPSQSHSPAPTASVIATISQPLHQNQPRFPAREAATSDAKTDMPQVQNSAPMTAAVPTAVPPPAAAPMAVAPVALGLQSDVAEDSIEAIDSVEELLRSQTADTTVREAIRTQTDVRLPRQVAMQLMEAARQLPDRPVEIALNPEELGKVRMTLNASETSISVVLAAERPETFDLLRRNLETLSAEFRALGYDDINFSFAGGDAQGDNPEGQADIAADLTHPSTEAAPDDPAPAQISLGSGIDIRL